MRIWPIGVWSASLLASALLAPASARAIPGPDTVVVLANASVPGSVALAMRYADARDIPDAQVCVLPMPTSDTIPLDDYQSMILAPLRDCLGPTIEARTEAIVVMRGVPMRVSIPVDGGHNVSITAALSTWRSTLDDDTTPLLGTSPGQTASCGTSTCYAARVQGPFSISASTPFVAGFERSLGGVHHRPVLATMLHGLSDEDAGGLIDVALAAEQPGQPAGEIILMRGADSARGVLDSSYTAVSADLAARGETVRVVDFDANLIDHALAGFAVGTSSLGATIEGNTYVRGALVDNLTSYGALPSNFAGTGETQVAIARWVAAGVGGVHGTVDEPLNNAFPSRRFLVSYADGATLAESFFGAFPYVYWLNLVLGDPMLAPYAERPSVVLTGTSEGATLSAATTLHVAASTASGRAVTHVALYVDGVEVASADASSLDHCLAIEGASEVQLLAVATTEALAAGAASPWPAKGWQALHVSESGTATACAVPADAATLADAGPDTTPPDAAIGAPAPAASCGCGALGRARPAFGAWIGLLVVCVVLRRRAR